MELALWGAINDFHRIDGGRFLGRAIPCYGVESSSRLLRYYDLKPGEWRRQKRTGAGFDWIENAHGRRALRRNAKSGAGKGASDGFSPSCRAEH